MTALLGISIEARGRSQHHRSTIIAEIGEQPLAELIAIVDGKVDDGVESTLWHRAETARNLVDTFDDDITASNTLVIHTVKVRLRGFDCGLGKDLAKTRWRQTGLSQTHGDGIDLTVAGHHATYTGTTGAVAL